MDTAEHLVTQIMRANPVPNQPFIFTDAEMTRVANRALAAEEKVRELERQLAEMQRINSVTFMRLQDEKAALEARIVELGAQGPAHPG